jgi:hypothetical protein
MDLTLLVRKELVLATLRFLVPTNFNVEVLTIPRGIGIRYETGRVLINSKLSYGYQHMNIC